MGDESIIPVPYRSGDEEGDLLTEKDYEIDWEKYGLDVENFVLEQTTVDIPYTVGNPEIDNGSKKAISVSRNPEVQ